MTIRVPLPDGFDARPFRVEAAIAAGVGRSRLSGRDLQRPFWGVRVRTPPGTPISVDRVDDLCEALALRMPQGAFFSHATAAQLMGFPLPYSSSFARPIHVSVAAPARAMDARDVVGHSLSLRSGDLRTWNGFRVTSPERTWLDLAAAGLTLFDLVAVGDYLVHWEHPLTTIARLTDAAAGYQGRRGRTLIRAALPLLRTRAESPRETVLRLIIVIAGLPEPECNLNIYDSAGRFLARADLAYPDFKLMLEYQGDQHRTDKAQWRRDIRRSGDVEDAGWQILQFTDDDLKNPASLVARVERRLRGRGWAGRVAARP